MRLLARGMRTRAGLQLSGDTILRVIDRINANPELSARLDKLDKQTFRREFLILYEADRDLK